MTPHEAAKIQLKNLKGQPLSRKLTHMLTYYHRALLGICVLLVCVASLIWHFATNKETVLSVVCINTTGIVSDSDTEIAQALGIDNRKQEIVYTNLNISDALATETYQSQTKLFAMIVSGEVDVILGPVQDILTYAYSDYFMILPDLFPSENLLYLDSVLLETEEADLWPAPNDPSAMVEPLPVMLCLEENTAAGILVNAEHVDLATAFLKYVHTSVNSERAK